MGDLRALEIFDHVPKGCVLHLQTDGAHEPHVHVGEHVVIDLGDCEFVNGELFLIEWQGGRRDVMQVTFREPGYWFSPLNRPRSADELEAVLNSRKTVYLSDGPLGPEYIGQYIKGRVLGVFKALDLVPAVALLPRR